ncbi:MAG: Txe/YoeB family addiction module toxin [Porphyromonadaceae bacterium]|nr:Txe/YoeB family addiction module toxin [Porphyromonadaceae bacterium]
MSYEIDFSEKAVQDIDFHKKAGNIALLRKIDEFLNELREHPFTGTGKPESLKYDLSGKWSRRINSEHRLIYSIADTVVYIHSAKGHYEKK